MKLFIFLVLAFSTFLISEDIEMFLECHDVIKGELQMGGTGLFAFTIKNNTEKEIKLITDSDQWASSPYWKANVEGPVDERCINIGVTLVSTRPIGIKPHLKIPAKGSLRMNYTGIGVGNTGTYTIWVEYKGTEAPEGYYKGYIKSNECTYTIKEPEGVDKEIFDLWQRQNPESPPCLFPMNMKKELLNPAYLLEKYPNSTYAAWAAYSSFSKPETASPLKIFKLIKENKYPLSNAVPSIESKDGWKRLYGKDFAKWQKEWIERILADHPNISNADSLKLIKGVMEFVLGETENCVKTLKELSLKGEEMQSIWAKEFLYIIEKDEERAKENFSK